MKEIKISTPYITLGQFLKLADVISSGGQAKEYLLTHMPKVDGVDDNRRGRKIYPGMHVICENQEFIVL